VQSARRLVVFATMAVFTMLGSAVAVATPRAGPQNEARPADAARVGRHHHRLFIGYSPPAAPPADLKVPCQNTDLRPAPQNVAAIESATVCLINQERAKVGLNALTAEYHLQAAADHHSTDMIQADYFDHTSPSGETAAANVLNTGYVPPDSAYTIGENLAWGTLELSTPAEIVAAWMRSPGHRANILDPRYRQTGLGVAPAVPASLSSGQPGGTFTQEFGTYTTREFARSYATRR
jgi:uncharacterized protein YkwD